MEQESQLSKHQRTLAALRSARKAIKNKTLTYIAGGFGLVAALAWNEATAHAARNDDDANILCLPADYVSVDLSKKIVHTFLTTPFNTNERFERRVNKVKKIDINL